MISNILLPIYRGIVALASIFILRSFFSLYYKSKDFQRHSKIIWLLYITLQISSNYISSISPFLFLICNIIVTFIILDINYWGNKGKKLLFCIAIHALGSTIAIIIAFVFKSIITINLLDFYLGPIFSNVILFSILIVLKMHYNKKVSNQQYKLWFSLLLMPISSIVLAYNIYILERTSFFQYILSIFSYCLILFVNLVIFEVYNKLSLWKQIELENFAYEQQVNLLKQHVEEIEMSYRNTRTLEHDLKNHLFSIYELLNLGYVEEAKNYVYSLQPTSNSKSYIINSGNIIIDSIIQLKSTMAKELGINFYESIFIPSQLKIEDKVMCIVLGNSLDNAIEATQKCQNNKFITLSLTYKKGALLLTISNSYNGKLHYDVNGDLLTSKNNHYTHGLGLKSIKKAIEPYDGELVIKTKENIFTIVILLTIETP